MSAIAQAAALWDEDTCHDSYFVSEVPARSALSIAAASRDGGVPAHEDLDPVGDGWQSTQGSSGKPVGDPRHAAGNRDWYAEVQVEADGESEWVDDSGRDEHGDSDWAGTPAAAARSAGDGSGAQRAVPPEPESIRPASWWDTLEAVLSLLWQVFLLILEAA